jgi:hypothetical protein
LKKPFPERADGVAEFKPQYHKKEKKKENHNPELFPDSFS